MERKEVIGRGVRVGEGKRGRESREKERRGVRGGGGWEGVTKKWKNKERGRRKGEGSNEI